MQHRPAWGVQASQQQEQMNVVSGHQNVDCGGQYISAGSRQRLGHRQQNIGVGGLDQQNLGAVRPGQQNMGVMEPGQQSMGSMGPGQQTMGNIGQGQINTGAVGPGQMNMGRVSSGYMGLGQENLNGRVGQQNRSMSGRQNIVRNMHQQQAGTGSQGRDSSFMEWDQAAHMSTVGRGEQGLQGRL